MTMQLIAEESSIQPGRPFWVALHVTLQPGWHTYWKNPGTTGMACHVEWKLPEGCEVRSLLWPTPKRYVEEPHYYFGYEEDFTLLAELVPAKEAQEGVTCPIEALLTWVACNDKTCLPGDSIHRIQLPVLNQTPEASDEAATRFEQAREKLPSTQWKAHAFHVGPDLIALTLVPPVALEPWDHLVADFFPEQEAMDLGSSRKKEIDLLPSNAFRLLFPYNSSEHAQKDSLQGVVVLAENHAPSEHKAAIAIHVPVEKYIPHLHEHASSLLTSPLTPSAFLLALLFAFLGGVLLNCMPCVLPVLSVKLMQLMKMGGESRRILLQHSLAYTFGIVLSFWLLAGALLVLQAYGESVGWGFQLQEPLFVALLALLLVLFSLNLFGLFEWGTCFAAWAGNSQKSSLQTQSGLFGAFCSGVLATAVATPCTGPFLGSAVGLAVTLTPLLALLIFTAIALGMSLPYTLLTISPKLMHYLPRPGAWMVRFKEAMGFLLLATVLWLVYVFAFETNLLSTLALLTAFLVAALGAWIYGNWSPLFHSTSTRLTATVISTCLLGLSVYIIVNQIGYVKQMGQTLDHKQVALQDPEWLPFSPEAVEEVVKSGQPAFVDFTASWCLICQANHYVLETERVREQFDKHGVVRFKADWTLSNPMITDALRQHGRSGVPLYLLYPPYANEPMILPQLLTPDSVLYVLQNMYQTTTP